MNQAVKVEDAVEVYSVMIDPGSEREFKGAPFKKGHIITEEDIPELLKMGKENIYILELDPGDVHEDTAGIRLGEAVAGPNVTWTGPRESRVNLFAGCDGLLKVNVPYLEKLNDLPDVILSSLPNNTVVEKGELLAGTKVIPLVVPEQTVLTAENICREAGWIIKVTPFQKLKVGALTGSEVYKSGSGTVSTGHHRKVELISVLALISRPMTRR